MISSLKMLPSVKPSDLIQIFPSKAVELCATIDNDLQTGSNKQDLKADPIRCYNTSTLGSVL
mgnify:CR=1 FL=1